MKTSCFSIFLFCAAHQSSARYLRNQNPLQLVPADGSTLVQGKVDNVDADGPWNNDLVLNQFQLADSDPPLANVDDLQEQLTDFPDPILLIQGEELFQSPPNEVVALAAEDEVDVGALLDDIHDVSDDLLDASDIVSDADEVLVQSPPNEVVALAAEDEVDVGALLDDIHDVSDDLADGDDVTN
ncbi:hypothetical protein DYB34_013930 [Aphanomyces astaci]|uniref:Uncharacterized protein n=1 Tax=Aphanomyces astaci TaxID=112090 RepID=A0A418C8Q1_APHAT|nr:hypothetical protein DYB34_013930 [Aphanomyces astaci]